MRKPQIQNQSTTMSFWIKPDLLDRLRSIPLEKVLKLCGAQPDLHDKHKWHTLVGALSVNGTKFMNWNRDVGGGGAIDLVIHLNHFNFKAGVDWLAHHFTSMEIPPSVESNPLPQWKPPAPDPTKLGHVHHYLSAQRAIPALLLEELIQSRYLYADARANAVFPLFGKHKTSVGAELRGTGPLSWRGLASGSRKDLGFFSIRPNLFTDKPSEIVLCESAIDAISCFALHSHRQCVSTSGARANPAWLEEIIKQSSQVYCGFDADTTGDDMAQAMIKLHPNVKRLRPRLHDWNDVLMSRA